MNKENLDQDMQTILKIRDFFYSNLKMGGGYNQSEVAMKLAFKYFKIKEKQRK